MATEARWANRVFEPARYYLAAVVGFLALSVVLELFQLYGADRQSIVPGAHVAFRVLGGVAFLLYFSVAYGTAEVLDPLATRHPRILAGPGFLIPVVNLVLPFRMIGDVHAATHQGARRRAPVVWVWWLFLAMLSAWWLVQTVGVFDRIAVDPALAYELRGVTPEWVSWVTRILGVAVVGATIALAIAIHRWVDDALTDPAPEPF
jgi:hypothetical protein